MEKTARKVAAHLREQGHIAYFAGGCVRDMVRGLTPKDFDIATDARPETVQKLFPRTYAVGAHFGVIIVLENGFQFEVATFRSDDAYIDGRHPSAVHFSSPEEDAKRRDFTINGMFYDPVADEVIDLVGGRADIAAKLVRAIGDPAKRFAEDRLRMLRAVRFATVLDYEIDKETWDALVANAASINRDQRGTNSRRAGADFSVAESRARLGLARCQRPDARNSAGDRGDERRCAARTIPSRRRRLRAHPADVVDCFRKKFPCRSFSRCYFTTWRSR